MPSDSLTYQVSVQESILLAILKVTVVVLKEESRVVFKDYWGNTLSTVKIAETDGGISGALENRGDVPRIVVDTYGAREDIVQEALTAWLDETREVPDHPPTVWDFIEG